MQTIPGLYSLVQISTTLEPVLAKICDTPLLRIEIKPWVVEALVRSCEGDPLLPSNLPGRARGETPEERFHYGLFHDTCFCLCSRGTLMEILAVFPSHSLHAHHYYYSALNPLSRVLRDIISRERGDPHYSPSWQMECARVGAYEALEKELRTSGQCYLTPCQVMDSPDRRIIPLYVHTLLRTGGKWGKVRGELVRLALERGLYRWAMWMENGVVEHR